MISGFSVADPRLLHPSEERYRTLVETVAAAVSALAHPEDRRRALAAGYQVHVAKPVEASELLAAVARLVEGHPLRYLPYNQGHGP